MAAIADNSNKWRTPLRILAWSAAALLMLAPVVAMQLTDEIAWGTEDFVFAYVLIVGCTAMFDLAARRAPNFVYLAAATAAIGTAFVLIWGNAALGIIKGEYAGANALYGGVLAILVIGGVLARFRAAAMTGVLLTAAAAQVAIGALALIAGWGAGTQGWPWQLVGLTGMYAVGWLLSAALFRRAAAP